MKKLLGISLVAVLAATPLMAGAAVTDAAPTSFASNAAAADITAATASTAPKYQLMAGHDNDVNAASAGYVKGAYNAAIKAVNAVDARVDGINTAVEGKQDALTAGAGVDIDANDKITVDYVTTGGLELDGSGDTAKLQVKTDGSTIGKDSTSGALKVVAGGITNTELGANAVQTGNIANGTILVEDVNNSALSTGQANNNTLTTKGYVDDAITGLGIGDYATIEGVENTIKAVTIDVTDTHALDKTTGSIVVMTQWGSNDATNNGTTYTYLADASITGGVSAAINDNSVDYAAANTSQQQQSPSPETPTGGEVPDEPEPDQGE